MDHAETKRQIGIMNLGAVGAREFVGGPDFLQFSVRIVPNRRDKMRVTLDPMDWYRLDLYVKGKLVKSVDQVYCDQIGEAVYQMGTR